MKNNIFFQIAIYKIVYLGISILTVRKNFTVKLMVKIINREKLIENGETSNIRKGRDLALQCLEQAVNAAEPKRLIKAKDES